MRRVVITGLGAVSPIGDSKEEILNSIKEGRCAVDFIENTDVSDLKVKIACQCRNFSPLEHFTKKELKRLDRVNQLAVVSARKAVADSGLDIESMDPVRVGVVFSSGIGGLDTLERETLLAGERGFDRISPFFIPMAITNMSASHIAIDLKIHGHVSCPVTACAGSSNAVAEAYRNIKAGYSDAVLAGGAEASINRLGLGGFSAMRALSETDDITRASIPFDRERSGFVMGEGACTLVLEELESAKRRNAHIYGEIIGTGISCDAGHITAPDESGEYVKLAMEMAIKEAGIAKEDIKYINAHGTSTHLNDRTETLAVRRTFKEHAEELKISSTKSMTGHLLGASGALEIMISAVAMNNDFIPPTVNYREYDEECSLNIVPNKGIDEKYDVFMSNSLGFGGHNVSIIVRRYEDEI